MKDQKRSLFVPLSYFKAWRFKNILSFHTGSEDLGVVINQYLVFQRQVNIPQFVPNKSLGKRFLSNSFTLLRNIDILEDFNELSK